MKKRTKIPPLLGFCAWSGSGKTTLLTKLIPLLSASGLNIGVIKHAHHNFDIDYPGKDSYQLREAGAKQILVASRHRMAWIREIDEQQDEPSLDDALNALDLEKLDLILIEGFKHEHFPKIEIHRPALMKPLLFPDDKEIIAIASDGEFESGKSLPDNVNLLDLNQPEEIARFVIESTLKK
jgi:molybdopterin-guanine dinucleotide biosynthesis protein B